MNFDAIYAFQMPTKVVHGFNAIAQVGKEAKGLGIKKALIVTDPGVKGAGLIDNGLKSLESAGIPAIVFSEVEEEPGTNTVANGADLLKAEGCSGVIVVGGGSPMCAGKGIALLATNHGSIADYEGIEKYKSPPLPVIGIPTTAGAGSEVSGTFIITDEKRNYKMSIAGSMVFPRAAILDPVLLRNIPFWPGINAAMDALSHAIGACCTNNATPITDSLAMASIAMMMRHLVPSVLTQDLEAKNQQLMASVMANMACGNAKLDLIHGLSHPLGSFHIPHGLANGILIPYVMEFNLPVCQDKYARMAMAMGESGHGLTVSQLARRAIERIKRLFIEAGFPRRIPSDAVDRKEIPNLVKQAMTRPMVKFNRRKSTEKELEEIYEKAFKGWD
ncbi:MAG: iron-containing alcohol dehydrogenase [Thermodesulfobacteriota bacterium]